MQAVVDGCGGLFCEIVDDIGMGAQDEIFLLLLEDGKNSRTNVDMSNAKTIRFVYRVYYRGWNPTQLLYVGIKTIYI